MSRILVTGASGLLGLNLCLQTSPAHQVLGVVNSVALHNMPFAVVQKDLTAPQAIQSLIDAHRPDMIVHCAAMANLDQCESQPENACRINAELPGEIANLSRKLGIKLAHISTDAVFDGVRGSYSEEDQPNPLGVYAQTKLAGEKNVSSNYPQALIARVNFYGYSISGQRSLSEFFLHNLMAKQPMNGFSDVFFCPLLANDLAAVLIEMLDAGLEGIYHTVSAECLSKYDFGCRIAHKFGLDETLIKSVSVKESGLLAARSPNLSLKTQKLASALGRPLPDQRQGIDSLYSLYKQGYGREIQSYRAN